MPRQKRNAMDDGFQPELAEGASFDGLLEMPVIKRNDEVVIPTRMVPFSKQKYAVSSDFICFNEQGRLLPSHSLNHLSIGNCAEVDAINSALNDGVDIGRLHIYTINADSRRFGTVKPACENCTAAFRGKIKRNYTGWHKESE